MEDHPRTCKWLLTPIYKPCNGHLDGEPRGMVINYLLTGMMLQVPDGWDQNMPTAGNSGGGPLNIFKDLLGRLVVQKSG